MTDIQELVERLRRYAKDQGGWIDIDDTLEEAADAIERLREALATYRELREYDRKARAALEAKP